jgi:hypothetical protein
MRWTFLVCTTGTYVILLLALAERQVSAGAERLHRTSVLSIGSNASLKRITQRSYYIEP